MANVTYTVPNKNGSYDGDMVVKQYTSINIDTGDTVTVDQPTRGLMILCQGDCTINGTLSMKGRGAFANPTIAGGSDNNSVDANGLRLPFLTSTGSSSLTASNTLFNGCGNDARNVLANFRTISADGDIITLVRQGANGGSAVSGNSTGNNGSNGSTGQTGGGATGGAYYDGGSGGSTGNGAYGSCFSGGSASGGINGAYGQNNSDAVNWGGAGSDGNTGHSASVTGGCGNPTGGNDVTDGNAGTAEQGTGGLIILIVGGNLTIGSSGIITANGSTSAWTGNTNWDCTGGGSGGGNIVLAYKGTYTNNGSVTANGGVSGTVSGSNSRRGGNGGNGSVQTLQIL